LGGGRLVLLPVIQVLFHEDLVDHAIDAVSRVLRRGGGAHGALHDLQCLLLVADLQNGSSVLPNKGNGVAVEPSRGRVPSGASGTDQPTSLKTEL